MSLELRLSEVKERIDRVFEWCAKVTNTGYKLGKCDIVRELESAAGYCRFGISVGQPHFARVTITDTLVCAPWATGAVPPTRGTASVD